ncbi:MAG: hypothetical protein E7172_02805 [Firmicutes bacterium]|nr:hypothetical protein [Bacillota bacterium]
MNNNLTYEVVKKEVVKKIINYLYQNNDITISEYETLLTKCDEKINKIKDQIDKEKDNYIYPVKVDIRI